MNLCLYLTIDIKSNCTQQIISQKKKKFLICSNSNFFSSVDEMFISGIFKHMKNRGNLFHYRDTYRLTKNCNIPVY